MKRILLFIIMFFGLILTPKAYVRIDTNSSTYITPKSYSGIMNVNSPWDYNAGTEVNLNSPWLTSPSQFWSASGLSGEYLNVGADYYIGVWNVLTNADTLNYSGNLTPDKLRCGIGGSYRSGYDATYTPSVTNFKVEFFQNKNINGFSQFLYHITFNYSQKIKPVNINSSNITCWFENDNSLFAQPVGQSNQLMYYYYNKEFSYSVSKDANTGLLQDITSQNETIIKQNEEIKNAIGGAASSINSNLDGLKDTQNQTNQKLDDMNSFLKDETEPNVDVSSLGTVSGLLPEGPVDSLLNIPFKFLSVITSSMSGTCVPVSGNWVFDSTLTIPCFSEQFYSNVPSLLMNFISLIPSAFILISYFKHLYKKVDRAMNLETNADDEWGVL